MSKSCEYFKIPSAIDKTVAEVIINQLKSIELSPGKIGGLQDSIVDTSLRKCNVTFLQTDHWVSGMLAHFIHCANIHHFKYDLHSWSDYIQYTVYDTIGDMYSWHVDTTDSIFYPNMCRKLSISLCLSSSDSYEGGELQLYDNVSTSTIKMDCGDAIIFSSDIRHRVKPIKCGKRISLVGWYGGPYFK